MTKSSKKDWRDEIDKDHVVDLTKTPSKIKWADKIDEDFYNKWEKESDKYLQDLNEELEKISDVFSNSSKKENIEERRKIESKKNAIHNINMAMIEIRKANESMRDTELEVKTWAEKGKGSQQHMEAIKAHDLNINKAIIKLTDSISIISKSQEDLSKRRNSGKHAKFWQIIDKIREVFGMKPSTAGIKGVKISQHFEGVFSPQKQRHEDHSQEGSKSKHLIEKRK